MRQILNTLYVMTPHSYLHLENDTLRVDVDREKRMQVPLHHLGGVVCLGNIMISPALMHRCADDGISLVLLDGNGRFKARLEGAVSGNILLRQAQHRQAADRYFALGCRVPCWRENCVTPDKFCCVVRVNLLMKQIKLH
jgi:CRISPR-associated protein Cas1